MTRFINWRRSRRRRKEHELYILIINRREGRVRVRTADTFPSPISPGKVTRSLVHNGHVDYASDTCMFADTTIVPRVDGECCRSDLSLISMANPLIFERLLHLRPASLSFVPSLSFLSLIFLRITLYGSIFEYMTEFSFLEQNYANLFRLRLIKRSYSFRYFLFFCLIVSTRIEVSRKQRYLFLYLKKYKYMISHATVFNARDS